MPSSTPLDWPSYKQTDAMSGGYPVCLPTDFSPMDDAFVFPDSLDKPYLADSLSTQPDYSLDDWVLPENYDRPMSTVEPVQSSSFASLDRSAQNTFFTTSVPPVDAWRTPAPPAQAPFGALPKLDSAFDFANPAQTASFSSSCQISPRELGSPTPSLCDDGPAVIKSESAMSPAAQAFETKPLKRSTSASSDDVEEPSAKRMPRKRGRPRLNRSESELAAGTSPTTTTSTNSASKPRCTRRLPHNQVERKYREGLNAELERLRRAVPTLPQRDSNDLNAPPKPSKATVLASAIDYIKFIEADRERLLEEIEQLRGVRHLRNPSTKLRGYGWNKSRSDTSSPLSSGDE